MFSLLPPIFLGPQNSNSNANSNPFRIRMFANPQSDASVLAQELREFGLKWTFLYTPAIVAAVVLALAMGINGGVLGFLVLCAAMLSSKVPAIERALEIRGHETEVQARALLYNEDAAEHRLKEAVTMQRGYGDIFKKWEIQDILVAMQRHSASSARYVLRKSKILERYDSSH